MTRLANNKGFTLIELMIATVIVALAAGLAAPQLLNQMAKYRLNGASKRFAWKLMATRVRAINQSQDAIVEFINNHEYAIGIDSDDNGVLNGSEGVTTDTQASYYNVTYTASNGLGPVDKVIFSSKGRADRTVDLAVSNASGTKNISIIIVGMVRLN